MKDFFRECETAGELVLSIIGLGVCFLGFAWMFAKAVFM